MILDIGSKGMDGTTPINFWRPLELLNVENSSFRYGLMILNQPIKIPEETMLSLWKRASFRLTVDGGTNRWFQFAQNMDCVVPPELITGDMDSVKQNVLAHFKSKGTQVILTPDQNETDFTKGLRHAQAHIVSQNLELDGVIAVCETSGRLDQILTNLNTLFKAKDIIEGLPLYQLARDSLTWLLKPGIHHITVGKELVLKRGWCSLVPLGAKAEHVTTSGLKWNLENRTLEFGGMVSTSNSYSGESVVTVKTDSTLLWSMGLCDDQDT